MSYSHNSPNESAVRQQLNATMGTWMTPVKYFRHGHHIHPYPNQTLPTWKTNLGFHCQS
ncbi:hypothetical protein Fuma_00809 [Fuerstiella marisgermanici]|uniref:Uncharacterized protein n=1 Tax=Fuerstiella marisgermanici TaxID=1891926 RepID=A0A1P8WB11_9PLAN|nr:hypothetical protein Fuma_00809 [Fuerstiella marisgermanici]